MFRNTMLAAVAAAFVLAVPVEAKRVAPAFTPLEKLVRADAVVIGKVTALEKDPVTATPNPGDPNKISYKVAVIKVESGLVGAANVTHVKVAFIPPPPADPNTPPVRPGRGGFQIVNLTEGMEGLFYLSKHHSGEFYIINPLMAPSDTTMTNYKDQVAQAKKCTAVLTDPAKSLKAEKADERSFAAVVLVNKYRAYPETGGNVGVEKVSAEESKLILKGLAAANWKGDPNDGNAPNAFRAFSLLALNEKDGWKYPVVKPGEDYIDKTKEAFTAWLDSPGKDYQINKWVPKKK